MGYIYVDFGRSRVSNMESSPGIAAVRPFRTQAQRRIALGRLSATLFFCTLALSTQAQQVSRDQAEFAVLRTGRVTVPTGESTHLNCSVVGTGDAAQLNCESHSGSGEPLVYHVALLIGSDKVGYVVSCGGLVVVERPGNGSGMDRFRSVISRLSNGGTPAIDKTLEQHHQQRVAEAWRIACHPLSAGQVVKGSVENGKLNISVGSETKTYRIETSAYIGSLTKEPPNESSAVTTPPSAPSTGQEPNVKLAVHTEPTGGASSGSGQPDQPNTPASTAKVMVSSEPTGGDIYVDGNFMGNTPSLIELPAGSHTVRVEAKGQNRGVVRSV
jgi:hypothetical protein